MRGLGPNPTVAYAQALSKEVMQNLSCFSYEEAALFIKFFSKAVAKKLGKPDMDLSQRASKNSWSSQPYISNKDKIIDLAAHMTSVVGQQSQHTARYIAGIVGREFAKEVDIVDSSGSSFPLLVQLIYELEKAMNIRFFDEKYKPFFKFFCLPSSCWYRSLYGSSVKLGFIKGFKSAACDEYEIALISEEYKPHLVSCNICSHIWFWLIIDQSRADGTDECLIQTVSAMADLDTTMVEASNKADQGIDNKLKGSKLPAASNIYPKMSLGYNGADPRDTTMTSPSKSNRVSLPSTTDDQHTTIRSRSKSALEEI